MENPVGSLRHRPYMNGELVTEVLTRTTVDYCAFDKPYKKPTDLWTTFDYKPEGNTSNGRCNDGQCGHTTTTKHGKPKHRIGIACESERKLAGKHIKQQLWSIPHSLTKELMKQMHENEKLKPHEMGEDSVIKDIVFDLFSGGESWRNIIESYDFTYCPVDIKKHVERCQQGKGNQEEVKKKRMNQENENESTDLKIKQVIGHRIGGTPLSNRGDET
jgi:hypothetical protein